ncbi:hypothetical protein N7539_000926 [Penicillium diatomitis]|uniref:peptidylprolyl isomerase n=1 Tax=Penicillium diatomitis TaxID=2819901 RepID=A0A9W9XNG2_9EURO|nr:uncharacterized protein N7539_000926 [Penicillium diatomitis]KAJ5495810.1 hypothetical protein N7539_000926 [Penicillium diatomitis]
MLSATPARQRTSISQSRPPPSGAHAQARQNAQGRQEPELPEYQPPEFIISPEANRKLRALLDMQYLEVAKKHIHDAGMQITYSAGEVSDHLRDAQTRYQKSKEKRRNDGDGQEEDAEAGDEAYRRLAEQERKVGEIMGRLEERMRHMVDSDMKLVRMTESLKDIDKEEAQRQHAILGARQTRSQRRERRPIDSEDEDAEEDDPAREPTPVREIREANAQNPPSRRLNASLAEGQQKWEELSLTQRYANNNDYTGFYRVVHDSKYPGDEAPPLPHSSTWFAHMEDPQSAARDSPDQASSGRTRNQRQPSPVGSDDIAIDREKISMNCPLTLLRFKDPVISKCKHRFERDAIMEMITQARPMPVPGSRARQKAVKCPICGTPLTAEDLAFDRAMKRRVKRAEEEEARRAENSDSDDDDSDDRPSKREQITLASDAVDPDDDAVDIDQRPAGTQIKSEPVPSGQRESLGTSEEDGEDDEEEEEVEEEEGEEENESEM